MKSFIGKSCRTALRRLQKHQNRFIKPFDLKLFYPIKYLGSTCGPGDVIGYVLRKYIKMLKSRAGVRSGRLGTIDGRGRKAANLFRGH